MSTSVRALVAGYLAPIIPDTWKVDPHTVKTVDKLPAPTVYVEHTTIEPAPEAPAGHVHNTVVVTILSHLTDYQKAEDALDSDVLHLIEQLDTQDAIAYQRAEKITVKDTYLGWAITLTFITTTETE
ncbi:hypothetical protein [Microbacterium sp.]|uniref:hypothetical protein n=1 Tax=Microbacterium sp. TaxID=51671 RepID=UPI003A8E0FB7